MAQTKEQRAAYYKARQLASYGLTQDQYQTMLDQQGGGCAICGDTSKLGVDYDHSTGQIRGLLCIKCDTALGMFMDDISLMQAACSYLQERKGNGTIQTSDFNRKL